MRLLLIGVQSILDRDVVIADEAVAKVYELEPETRASSYRSFPTRRGGLNY